MSSETGNAKAKKKTSKPGKFAESAGEANIVEDGHRSEQPPPAGSYRANDEEVGRTIRTPSYTQESNTLDPTEHPQVHRYFDDPQFQNNPGLYLLSLKPQADGSTKAEIRGPFDADSEEGSPSGTSSPRAEISGAEDIPADTTVDQDTSGVYVDPGARKVISDENEGTHSGTAQAEQPRAFSYTPEHYVWMNDWSRRNRNVSHRDAKMAAAFLQVFGFTRTEGAMKGRFQAMNESGQLDGSTKTLTFYQDRANEPKKRKDDKRIRRVQPTERPELNSLDEDGADREKDPREVTTTEATTPQRSRKRGRSVLDASGFINLAEDVDMDDPRPPKKADRTKSLTKFSVNRVRESGPTSNDQEEPYMPSAKEWGPMATPKNIPPPKWSGSPLMSALPDGVSASVVAPGPSNSISPDYRGGGFTPINTSTHPRPAVPSSTTSGGTAMFPRPSSSGGGSAQDDDDDDDTDMDD